ncbi:MAG TPA: hypothetical protein VK419_07295 [Bryobacteraceae bacterium]|nr:hypothetical protein [Bryobacteraceae bacterium]
MDWIVSKLVRFLMFAIAWVGIMGFLVLTLWNLLIPAILHLPAITFWQALGLLVLSRVLFGRIGGWGHRMSKARFARGWTDLTPEERERFRRAMGSHHPPESPESGSADKL